MLRFPGKEELEMSTKQETVLMGMNPVSVRGETSEILYIITFVICVHGQYDTKEEQCHVRV